MSKRILDVLILDRMLLQRLCSVRFRTPLFQILFPVNSLLRVSFGYFMKMAACCACFTHVVIFMLLILFVLKIKTQSEFFPKGVLSVFS